MPVIHCSGLVSADTSIGGESTRRGELEERHPFDPASAQGDELRFHYQPNLPDMTTEEMDDLTEKGYSLLRIDSSYYFEIGIAF